MTAPKKRKPRAAETGAYQEDQGSKLDGPNQQKSQAGSKWREIYRVHPAVDIFLMMPDDELAELGEDIKANGLREPIKLRGDELLDGRNRLEAAERVGYKLTAADIDHLPAVDPVAFVISANAHRRHLTKQQKAEAIFAAHKGDIAAARRLIMLLWDTGVSIDVDAAIEEKWDAANGDLPELPAELDRRAHP
jgi:ParB-like chromosome segregation protein Spo0J